MAKKTLYVFRAENGIWRNELSAKIEVDEETLKKIEDEPEVPQEIAEKVIEAYGLEEDYFTADPNAKEKRYKPKNPFKYFLKVSIIWKLLIELIFVIVMLPTTMASFLSLGNEGLFDVLGTLCRALVFTFSGIYLTAHIVKKTVYGKQVTQYDYIYPYLPAQITICMTIATQFALEGKSLKQLALGYVITFIALIIQAVLTAVLLKSRVEEDEKKREKTVKRMSIVAILATAVYTLFFVALSLVSPAAISTLKLASIWLELILLIVVIFGIRVGAKKFPKSNKLWFAILPIAAMLLPKIIVVIDLLFT